MAIPYIVSGSQNYKVFLPSSDLSGNVLLATILQMTLTTGMVNCSLTRISTSPSLLELRRCSTRPLASSCTSQKCHEATWSKSEYLNWLLRLLAKSKLFKIAQNKPELNGLFHFTSLIVVAKYHLRCSFHTAVLSGSIIPNGFPQDFISRPIFCLFLQTIYNSPEEDRVDIW